MSRATFTTIAVEVHGAKADAELRIASFMLAYPWRGRGIAWAHGIDGAAFFHDDLRLIYLAARIVGGRADHAGRGPLAVLNLLADFRARFPKREDVLSEPELMRMVSRTWAEFGNREVYRDELIRWCDRLIDLNRRIELAMKHERLARRALAG